jgi:hypothetical protein
MPPDEAMMLWQGVAAEIEARETPEYVRMWRTV